MAACLACGAENAEDARFCSSCGAGLGGAEAPREVRKTVTVVFSDVVGSTAVGEQLDPESLRRVMSRYFDAMAAVLERHGGTVEKFIGDAIMAVFGIPVVHEDDALRAVRAAAEMREELTRINDELARDYGVRIENRTGVNTGEVVAGDPAGGQRLVTGDAVNVAARLEQAAAPAEVLVGDTTYRLVRDAVETEPVEPLAAKGKAEPLSAHRLVRVVEGAEPIARRFESPLIGRERELELIRQAYRRAVDEQSSHLFTILGSAGIGKSRAVQEFLAELGDGATVVTGRCLSYGEGITYWPLVEILEELGSEEKIVQFLEGEPDARTIVNTVLTAVGQAEAAASPEETPWAVRKLFEALARERPLVVVLDDLQWAESTFLDLIEHVADFSRGAAILLLCVARPELLDERTNWGGGKLNATSILLEPLDEEASETLIENLLHGTRVTPETIKRVSDAAEGNPLFVEQLLAMLSEDGGAGGEIVVPPTIQALLAARLDRLDNRERTVIERGSVIGTEFWLRAVAELSHEPAQVGRALQLLIRKELIRPHRSTSFPNEDAFRFRHLLIRDAAYSGLPKELRAELHEHFGGWLEGERSGFDEIVGYHLEQAYGYRSELGPLDEQGRQLGLRAGERLGAAGERALNRFDMPAAANLLERALAVLPEDHPWRNELRLGLGDALEEQDLAASEEVLRNLVDDAVGEGDAQIEWRARLTLAWIQLANQTISARAARELSESAIEALTALGDDHGLARAWRLLSQCRNIDGDPAGIGDAMRQVLVHARQAGDVRLETEAHFWIGMASYFGNTPAPDARRVCEELLESAATPLQRAHASLWIGATEALEGQVDEGVAAFARARARYAELGLLGYYGGSAQPHADLVLLTGDSVAAEQIIREGDRTLEQLGDRAYRSTTLVTLAEVLLRQGRLDEAEAAISDSKTIGAPDDSFNVTEWASLGARILAARGELPEAETLAREAVAAAGAFAEYSIGLANSLIVLAEILQRTGQDEEARESADRALALYERKGFVLKIDRARALLAELEPA